MIEYSIIGDTKNYKGCLVKVIKGGTLEQAQEVLERMINAPTDNDKILMEGHFNLRIEEVPEKDQWWNDPFLAN